MTPTSGMTRNEVVQAQRDSSSSQFNRGGRTLTVNQATAVYSSSSVVRVEVQVQSARPTRSTLYRTYGIELELIGGVWRITRNVNVEDTSYYPALPTQWWTFCF